MSIWSLLSGASLLAILAASVQPEPPASAFKIVTKRPDDSVQVQADNAKALFVIKSPFGISRATIERLADQWPKQVVVRLHLKGLENFKAATGKTTLHAAVAVQQGKPNVRQWKDGQETPGVAATSAFWMDVQIQDGGKPAQAIPLKDGYFEVTLPAALFAENPKSITLDWIDFYR